MEVAKSCRFSGTEVTKCCRFSGLEMAKWGKVRFGKMKGANFFKKKL
jgi:hypothetical protein